MSMAATGGWQSVKRREREINNQPRCVCVCVHGWFGRTGPKTKLPFMHTVEQGNVVGIPNSKWNRNGNAYSASFAVAHRARVPYCNCRHAIIFYKNVFICASLSLLHHLSLPLTLLFIFIYNFVFFRISSWFWLAPRVCRGAERAAHLANETDKYYFEQKERRPQRARGNYR